MSRSAERTARARRNRGVTILFTFAVLYVAFLYLPVLFLPLFSFNDSKFISFPLSGFTLRWYNEMLADRDMLGALRNSLVVGISVSILSTILGMLAAKALTRYVIPGKEAITGFIMIPLFIPEIILGISLLILWSAVGLPLSLLSVMVGHTLLCVPFAMAILMSRFDGFDRSLEEASLDLGESGWMTFWRVTFPLVMPGIASSLLLTFIVSFDEFLVAFFLSGTEPTLPVFMWGQLRFPAKLPAMLALGALILIASTLLVILAEWVRRMGTSEDKQGYGIA